MGLFLKIKQFFHHICHRQAKGNILCQPYLFERAAQADCNSQPNVATLESNYKITSIPGTGLFVGNVETVLMNAQQQLSTTSDNVGVLCGCNHQIYQVYPEAGKPGIGGQCSFCMADILPMVQQNLISVALAQSKTLFCTDCRSLCRMCATVICSRHASAYPTPSGVLFLCPKCAKKYDEQQFFNKTIAFLLSPLLDRPPKNYDQNGGNYEV